MRATLTALAVASLIGAATPALADYGAPGSAQRAVFAAGAYGIVGISEVQYDNGRWQVQGRDPAGRNLTVYVDALTGAVTKVSHW